jgi:hypothetical protein
MRGLPASVPASESVSLTMSIPMPKEITVFYGDLKKPSSKNADDAGTQSVHRIRFVRTDIRCIRGFAFLRLGAKSFSRDTGPIPFTSAHRFSRQSGKKSLCFSEKLIK